MQTIYSTLKYMSSHIIWLGLSSLRHFDREIWVSKYGLGKFGHSQKNESATWWPQFWQIARG